MIIRKKRRDDTPEIGVPVEETGGNAAWIPESSVPAAEGEYDGKAGSADPDVEGNAGNESGLKDEEVGPPEYPPVFVAMASAFARGRGMPSEELDSAMAELRRIGEGWRNGTPDVGMLETVIKGLDYDRAVAVASRDGEIRGRNAGIEETYMRPEESDGLPHLSGGGTARSGKRVASIFDLARNA